jgi:hypothetical protein
MYCSTRFAWSALALPLVAVIVTAGSAFARPRDLDNPSLLAHNITQSAGVRAAEHYSTGFEMPEFQSGFSITGQAGWTCSPDAIASSLITSFNPDTGDQHLRLIDNGGVANSTRSAVLSPIVPTLSLADVSVRYAINGVTPGPNGGADYELAPQSTTQGLVVTRMRLNFTGDILVIDDIGDGPQYVDTGADWTTGGYHTLSILKYFHDGVAIYSGQAIGATSFDQIALVHDNFEAPEETGDFDNLLVTAVPEPSSAAIVLLAIGALRRRRCASR